MSESQPSTTSSHHHDQTELEKLLRKTKPWFAQNATFLIYALAAVLAITAVVVYAKRKPSGDLEASRSLLLAVSPEDFRDVADEFPETKIGVWSRLRQADRLLDDAVSHMFTDRAAGIEELDKAEAAYQRLAERTNLDERVRERVLIGLARIAECRCDGTDDSANKAIAAWQRVLDEFENSLVKDHAESRVATLGTQESKDFYAWFYKQNPSPSDTPAVPGVPANSGMPEMTIPGGTTPEAPVFDDNADAPKSDDVAPTTPDEAEAGEEEKAVPTTKEKTPAADQPSTGEADPIEDETDAAAKQESVEEKAETPAEQPKTDDATASEEKADAADGGDADK